MIAIRHSIRHTPTGDKVVMLSYCPSPEWMDDDFLNELDRFFREDVLTRDPAVDNWEWPIKKDSRELPLDEYLAEVNTACPS